MTSGWGECLRDRECEPASATSSRVALHLLAVLTGALLAATSVGAEEEAAPSVADWNVAAFDEECDFDHPTDPLGQMIEEIAPRGRPKDVAELATVLLEAECAYGVEVHLLLALIERESHFDHRARGPRGSVGLMQVRPSTARAVTKERGWGNVDERLLEDARMNVRLGTVYLAAMYERFGDWESALTAYNMGPSRLSKRLRSGKTGTSPYARWILERREDLSARARLLETPALAENR